MAELFSIEQLQKLSTRELFDLLHVKMETYTDHLKKGGSSEELEILENLISNLYTVLGERLKSRK